MEARPLAEGKGRKGGSGRRKPREAAGMKKGKVDRRGNVLTVDKGEEDGEKAKAGFS